MVPLKAIRIFQQWRQRPKGSRKEDPEKWFVTWEKIGAKMHEKAFPR
jgi:hypothetical protein